MSEAVKSRWNMPSFRDALRAWRKHRADWRDLLAGAELPVEGRDLIGRVLRRARLWRSEKAELAQELIAHFADGLAAGENLRDLIQKFGNDRIAARLLTRSARRKRHPFIRIIARTWTAAKWTLGITLGLFIPLAIIYIALAIYFAIGEPQPKVDYAQILNAPALQTPPAQRAWPVYRDAAVHMQIGNGLLPMLFSRPDQADYRAAVQWFADHAADIESIRQAAQKKVLGFICKDQWHGNSTDDVALWPVNSELWDKLTFGDYGNPLLFQTPLPDIGVLSQLSGCLSADADLALIQNQPARVTADLIAMFSVADHIDQHGGLTAPQIAVQLRTYAVSQLERILRDNPAFLANESLTALAKRIYGPQVAADFFHFPLDQLAFLDLLQNLYTDNGHGNGHPSPWGFFRLADTADARDSVLGEWEVRMIWPIFFAFTPSRQQQIAVHNQLDQEISDNMHRPMRQADWRPYFDKMLTTNHEPMLSLFSMTFNFGMPFRLQRDYETYLGERDGALVAIALERFRRIHGNYPSALGALIPNFLSAIPADRITGAPVKYLLIAGKPLVYSVGVDQKDDGGAIAMIDTGDGKKQPVDGADWGYAPTASTPPPNRFETAGDWRLFPDVYLDYYHDNAAQNFMAHSSSGVYERH